MSLRTYKRVVPRSLHNAFQLCVEYAQSKKRMSVPRIADRLGCTEHNLYKWLGTARMPSDKILGFEDACGAMFVTQYLANSHNHLLVKIPSGKKSRQEDINQLQQMMNACISEMLQLAKETGNADTVVDQITGLMQDLAFHQENAKKLQQPDLF